MTSGIRHNTTLSQKIPIRQLENTTEELLTLISMIPQKGRLNYKLMPPHVKEQINKIVDIILKNTSVNEAYEKYLSSIDKISMTYSPSEAKQKRAAWTDNAITDIRKDLSNVILKDIKKQIAIHSNFTAFATALLDQYNSHHVEVDQIDLFDKSQVYDNAIITEDTSLYKDKEYLEKSANDGNQFAQYQLGKIYYSPDYGEPDYPLAISYLKDSAALGNDSAMYQLGRMYSNEDIPIYNMDQAISYLMESSNKNNSFAQLQLGIIYLWGKGAKRDVTVGKDFLAQAIKNVNPFAQQVLDSYETYRLQNAMNISYKLFTNIYEAISNQNDRVSTIAVERHYRNLSKKAMIEEQLKNPYKHSNSYESEK